MSFLVAKLYDALVAHAEWLCLADWRRSLVATLDGAVLEIGAGTGRNLEHYGPALERLVLAEPDRHMRAQLAGRLQASSLEGRTELCDFRAEQLDLADGSFDTVVATLVLCSVANPEQSIREAYRVLRPGGQLILIEHISAAEGSLRRRWQRQLDPIWSRLANGCHLDRDPRRALIESGFVERSVVVDELRGAPGFLRTALRGTWVKLSH